MPTIGHVVRRLARSGAGSLLVLGSLGLAIGAAGAMLSIYNEVYHPANGLNYISLYLSPFFSSSSVIGVAAGPWLVRLHAREVRDGRFHAWIERDDPHRLGRVGDREAWAFPSFFTQASLVFFSVNLPRLRLITIGRFNWRA